MLKAIFAAIAASNDFFEINDIFHFVEGYCRSNPPSKYQIEVQLNSLASAGVLICSKNGHGQIMGYRLVYAI